MKSFDLSRKDAQDRDLWRLKIKEELVNTGLSGKMSLRQKKCKSKNVMYTQGQHDSVLGTNCRLHNRMIYAYGLNVVECTLRNTLITPNLNDGSVKHSGYAKLRNLSSSL